MSRGWRRLWASLALSWFGTWAAVAVFANWQTDVLIRIGKDDVAGSAESLYTMTQLTRMSDLMGYAAWFGIFIPILSLPYIGLAYWTYRGFRRDRAPSPTRLA